jgi:hypothetical protein
MELQKLTPVVYFSLLTLQPSSEIHRMLIDKTMTFQIVLWAKIKLNTNASIYTVYKVRHQHQIVIYRCMKLMQQITHLLK